MFRKNLKLLIVILATISLAVMIGLVILYFYRFHGGLSLAHDKWGQFGDYFGGALGTLLSFVNFLILIGLHYDVKSTEHHKWITQIRIESFHIILGKLDKLTFENKDNDVFINNLQKDLRAINLHHYFHFSDKQREIAISLMDGLIKVLYEHEVVKSVRLNDQDNLQRIERSFKSFATVLEAKNHLLDYLHDVIMIKV